MKISKKAAIFNAVAITTPKRNSFDLSHEKMLTCNMGELIPIMCEEVNPNETWDIGGTTLCRTAPLARPMLSTVIIKKQHYFIRNQILWSNWNLFMTGGDKFNPEAEIPVPPYIIIPNGGFPVGSLADYLGFPSLAGDGTQISALPFAAYYRTWQEYFADENLQSSPLIMLTDGDNSSEFIMGSMTWTDFASAPPLFVNWERDYYTSCLPEPQKGPEVTIPLGSVAPIIWEPHPGSVHGDVVRDPQTGDPTSSGDIKYEVSGDQLIVDPAIGDPEFASVDNSANLFADLSAATSATINDLRKSFALQRLYERLMRGGSRIPEFLRTVWGAKPRNLELDRPDYFGGVKEFLSISEVLQQSQTTNDGDDASPQGNMTGHGVAMMNGGSKSYHTSDYGIILSLFWVKPKTLYYQGVRKSWLRLNSRFDYFFPDLAHIGEQPVLNAEVFITDDPDVNNETFGYMPYGTDLRYIPDTVHGEFRSTQKDWTMVREFDTPPALNSQFISTAGITRRVFIDTSTDTDTIYVQHFNKVFAKRPIPVYGTPQ